MSARKLTKGLISSASAVALVAGVFIGANPASAAETPVTGGTLYFYTHNTQFPNLDPQRMYTGRDIAMFGSYLMRTLVTYKPVAGADGNTLVADLATNTGVPSNKAKNWTFTLRPGVKWEDGSPITCADVKYGWSRTFAIEVFTEGPSYPISWLDIPTLADGSSAYKGPYVKTGQSLFDKAITCSADNRTIKFNLKRSVPDFNYYMTYLSAGPVPKSKDTGEKYDLRPFASGPYKIQKNVAGDEMVLVRNTYWSKGSDPVRTPYPDTIRVAYGLNEDIRDDIAMKDSIVNGVNLDGLQVQNVPTFFKSTDPKDVARRMNVYDPYVSYLTANNSAGHLDCLLVRKAIFFAFNNKALIDLSGGTEFYGEPGDGIVKPNLGMDYAPTTGNIHDPNYKIEGNPTYAKELLAQAKTTCPTTYDKVTNPDKGIVYIRPDTASSKKSAVLVEAAMKAAGIVIKYQYEAPGTYNAKLEEFKKTSDLFSSGWGPDWSNASTVIPELWGEGCCNYTNNQKTPEYKAFIDKVNLALVELDRKKQAQMWKELNQYGMDQYWYVRTVFGKTQEVWGSKVGGVFYWLPQGNFGFGKLYVKQ